MTKQELSKYGSVAKKLAKNHSVGDCVWSDESFIEGFNQAVQMLEPDPSLVVCPKCNTSAVVMSSFSSVSDYLLPNMQYPMTVAGKFICLKCRKEFAKQLNLSPEQP
jgi:hypothetical protein